MKDERRAEHPCPACGGRSYSWGVLQAHSFRFVPDEGSFWRRFFSGGWRIRARRCDECGNLQAFTEPDPSRTSKRARDAAGVDFS